MGMRKALAGDNVVREISDMKDEQESAMHRKIIMISNFIHISAISWCVPSNVLLTTLIIIELFTLSMPPFSHLKFCIN